jgi:hypothetical protein
VKTERFDGSQEREILTAMIVHKEFLAIAADKWTSKGLLGSPWSNIVAGWCVNYFKKYAKAPKSKIQSLFMSWEADGSNPEAAKMIDRYLADLSNAYDKHRKKIALPFLVDNASKYFQKIAMKRLLTEMSADLDLNRVSKATARFNAFQPIEIGSTAPVDFFQDRNAIKDAFSEQRESLVKYPGALGKFFGDELERDAFISFLAPEKRGKSWWLQDIAWNGAIQRKRVAFFEAGDMSKRQRLRRFGIRAAKRPLKPTEPGKPIRLPVSMGSNENRAWIDEYKELHFKEGLDWETAWNAIQKQKELKVRSNSPYLRLSCHPNSSLSVASMRNIIQGWERENWIPDIVVVDYADILAPPAGFQGEARDGINATWKELRRMSQELHCLVVTATQANAASYAAEKLGMGNFSEDKRKLAHVTGMIGINQVEEEKTQQIQRLNWLVLREDEFSISRCVYVGQCLSLANPAVVSTG